MKRAILACAAIAAGLVPAVATAQRQGTITSVYTELDLDRCQLLRQQVEEGAGAEWRCPGYGGVTLWIAMDDERFDMDAGGDNGRWESTAGFNALGERVEWRLRGGRAFAIIYRLRLFSDGGRVRSVLAVETVGGGGGSGCLIAWVDGALADANEAAREQADRHAAAFRCGRDAPRIVGRGPD